MLLIWFPLTHVEIKLGEMGFLSAKERKIQKLNPETRQ